MKHVSASRKASERLLAIVPQQYCKTLPAILDILGYNGMKKRLKQTKRAESDYDREEEYDASQLPEKERRHGGGDRGLSFCCFLFRRRRGYFVKEYPLPGL